VEEPELKSKELTMVLHFEADVPDRKTLGTRFENAFRPLASSFQDYTVNHRAICDKMSKRIRFSKSRLASLVVTEFSRLQQLAPVIDELVTEV
jgi:hypothetical protein